MARLKFFPDSYDDDNVANDDIAQYIDSLWTKVHVSQKEQKMTQNKPILGGCGHMLCHI